MLKHGEQLDLVILPLQDWKKCETEGFRTRDAHLMLEFARHPDVGQILVVDRPISIPEIILMRRRWKVRRGDLVYRRGGTFLTRVSEKVHVLDIVVGDAWKPLRLKRRWWYDVLSRPLIHKRVHDAIRAVHLMDYGVFMFAPLAAGAIGRLGESYLVFFAVDNWLVHPLMREAVDEVRLGYETLRESADVIVTNSESLKDMFSQGRSHVYFVPNGVDPVFFDVENPAMPNDLRNLKHPIVGYAGKIQERLDVELVAFLAERLPDVAFVFIGPLMSPGYFAALKHYPNVHYLGDKPYNQLPRYLAAFDVCMIPHVISELTNSMNPLKFYEYLAAGKPVVTTPVAGVQPVDARVVVASTRQEFLNAVRRLLASQVTTPYQIPPDWTWEFRAKQVLSIVCNSIQPSR